jgi:hypothetical protein
MGIVRCLQFLERPRVEVALTRLPPAVAEGLRLRARIVLGLFSRQDEINAGDAAGVLGLSERQVRNLLNE